MNNLDFTMYVKVTTGNRCILTSYFSNEMFITIDFLQDLIGTKNFLFTFYTSVSCLTKLE